ncbi:hypothetical protein [Paenibacillus macerans]|nr:hypothetical protein [Paenibacillus macerans]MCM3699485.1 hypothetical protein [Paenibacillus macerans]
MRKWRKWRRGEEKREIEMEVEMEAEVEMEVEAKGLQRLYQRKNGGL